MSPARTDQVIVVLGRASGLGGRTAVANSDLLRWLSPGSGPGRKRHHSKNSDAIELIADDAVVPIPTFPATDVLHEGTESVRGQKSPSCCHADDGRSGSASRQSRHETGTSPLVSRSRRSVHQSRFSASGQFRTKSANRDAVGGSMNVLPRFFW